MAKTKKVKSEYKLPNPLIYRLSNPNYTIYHRAALGGLAATVKAWGNKQPDNITAKVNRDSVTIRWNADMSDKVFLESLLAASFKLRKGMIDLPGQHIEAGRDDLRLLAHDGTRKMFLQHPQSYSSDGIEQISLQLSDDETLFFKFQKLNNYSHRGVGKTSKKGKPNSIELFEKECEGRLPSHAGIKQWCIPGAVEGAAAIQTSTDEAILLMYLIVGSAIYLLRPQLHKDKSYREKAQACLVVPNVTDLVEFSDAIAFINAQRSAKGFRNNYLSRVVGGAEDAALRFLLNLQGDKLRQVHGESISDCIVIAMGKVPWDRNQLNRSVIARVRGDYPEIAVFDAASRELGKARVTFLPKGESWVFPASPIPELVAANLASERHWCFGFKLLVKEKDDFQKVLKFMRRGLQAMKEAVKNVEDCAVINVLQEAWKFTMRNLYARAEDRESDEIADLDSRREKIRNEILRAKNADTLASWFLRFCADATKGKSLPSLQGQNGETVRTFIFDPRNFERFQNLCLFALVSYTSGENPDKTEGEN